PLDHSFFLPFHRPPNPLLTWGIRNFWVKLNEQKYTCRNETIYTIKTSSGKQATNEIFILVVNIGPFHFSTLWYTLDH
ncbi:MAG: hypothetical protein N4A41_10425, partial [Crocinitomicaceae bacterium]|nr:hypothetical protein [Crocinitomicaceae bacterium]